MARPSPLAPFVAATAAVWIAMIAILVVVPDLLEQWMPLAVARVVGWAAACGVWMIVVEHHWQRVRPLVRFSLQFGLWVLAALLATWISDQFRVRL